MPKRYTKEELINSIKRFVDEFKRIPIQKDFENLNGYPSRKSFTNHFEDFNTVVRLAGFEPITLSTKERNKKYTKEFLIQEIHRFHKENNQVPTSRDMDKPINNYPSSYFYESVFKTWNNALIEAGLPLNQVSQYTDEFLESEFHRFVNENGRIPIYDEFNNSDYPSFWCYQNRFGSWNKAVIAYGYQPNDRINKYYIDDELCWSSYEYTVSKWLRKNIINYKRDMLYKTFIDNYKGKMDCDYMINYNNQIWYVEVAGFLSDRKKLSEIERIYFFKLKYKEKLLKRQNVNYLIIKPKDLKRKTLEEIFSPMIGGVENWRMNLNVVNV